MFVHNRGSLHFKFSLKVMNIQCKREYVKTVMIAASSKSMTYITAWREFLGKNITDTRERQRVANELSVSTVTLMRWVNGTSAPRPQNLRQLLRALPQHRTTLIELISEEFPDFPQIANNGQEKDESQEIPGEVYALVLHAYTTVMVPQRFWTLSNSILSQALGQLDPNHTGLAVTLVKCMAPKNGIIRSLREIVGHGTPPWGLNLEQQAVLLGSESMAGFTVMNGRPLIRQNQYEHEGRFPAHWTDWEISAAAYPIQRAGAIAGSLIVSSSQPDYFLPFRQKLIEQYSELLSLAFEREEFYPIERINLYEMPNYTKQREPLATLHKRAVTLMHEAVQKNEILPLQEATELAWQQIEEQFLT